MFLFSASYSRVETVAGAIVLDQGIASIMPSRPGTVAALAAREGQKVARGQALVEIRSEEDAAGGRTAPRRIIDALEQQDGSLAAQTALTMSAAVEEQSRAAALIKGLGDEVASLDAQIASQRRLVEVAGNEFRDVQGVASKGFISRRDLETREAALIGRRQQLSQLEQARSVKNADMAQARRGIAQTGASAQAQAAAVSSTRAQLAQRLAEVETGRGYTLTSPIDGTVTALTARLGQPVNQTQPLMVVMPDNAITRAELYVSTAAAGFLDRGQEVRLAIEAFPYQRFGTVTGRIVHISSVAIPKATAEGGAVPVYLVTVELADPAVVAFGRRQPLLPGMTLSARIITEKQSLFEWLFEPLFAVRRR
ncbi:MAG TPA: HlyD family efflux transporter periplasmic adaptor subunit [Allosphingosinicella sp.]